MGDFAGEPSLGVDPRNGTVLFQANTETLAVSGFDAQGPGTAQWRDVSYPLFTVSADPILATDPVTGRTWASMLTTACSDMAYTDDDGASWTTVPVGCAPGAGYDHQTVGAGAFPEAALAAGTGAQRAVYYCAHNTLVQSCGVSTDGGRTFLPAQPISTSDACDGTGPFGHVKVARDGTAYVPVAECFSSGGRIPNTTERGIAVSRDGGTSWSSYPVPGTKYDWSMDPSLAIDREGAVYYAGGLQDPGAVFGAGPIAVSVSHDHGASWGKPVRVGVERPVLQTRFPAVVAGDGGRAAVAYLGSTEPGDGSNDPTWSGTWRLYVSFTADGGRTWQTTVATPRSPVQVGPVCAGGTRCDSGGAVGNTRNLLDFIDAALDPSGHVVIAFADGCVKDAGCTTLDRLAKASIAREVRGPSLYR